MRKAFLTLAATVFLAIAAFGAAPLPSARAQVGVGLRVDQLVLPVAIQAGGSERYFLHVTNDQPTDVVMEVRGLGQPEDGSFISYTTDQDENIYTARPYVTIAPDRFHLDANVPQQVVVDVKLPEDIGAGGRYAAIYTRKAGQEAAGEVQFGTAIATSIVLTVLDGDRKPTGASTGSFSSVDVGDFTTGQPVPVTAHLDNTGNYHFRAYAVADLTDVSGQKYASARTQLTTSSVLPGFSRDFDLTLRPSGEMPAGTYIVNVETFAADGRLVDSHQQQFELAAPVLFATPAPGLLGQSGLQTEDAPGSSTFPWIALLAALLGVLGLVMFALLFPRARGRRAATQ